MSHVLVIGAGYAGAHAARAARDAGARVTVVAPDGRHDLAPRLATVAAGAAPLGDGYARLGDLVGDVDVRHERVTAIDTRDREVALHDHDPVAYDALVVTVGSRPADPEIPGLATHARPLRTAADAAVVRRSLDDAERLIVIGGGATGTQLAGEVAAARPDLPVVLIETGDRLMAELGGGLGRHAARVLASRGVEVVTGRSAARFTGRGVVLDDGREIDGLSVWCGGFVPSGHDLLPGASSHEGRLEVDRYLRVGAPRDRVFVAGDAAAHRDVLRRRLAMSAQIAVQAGKAAGTNAALAARGERLRPARLVDLGWVATLGGGRGVAQVGPVTLAAPVVDRVVPLLHHAVDLRHLFQLGGLPAVARHASGMHHLTPTAERDLTPTPSVAADVGATA